ncbi:Protein ripply2 [Lonchura striata]|uniref:Protein ripply2 n=1 Tax=Lonchura striata TaxID=40157 RepID=A0A218ULB0_9PASE|nr:Protein ripply2 [Lonchura striata domestica]
MDAARAAERDGGPGKALPFFQHPVRYVPGPGAPGGRGGRGSPRLSPHRLLWPKSKAFDHLYSVGEKLLENFPVQATLFFYEDSGSEEEEEEEEEEERDDEEEEATGDVTAGHPRKAGSPGLSRPV